MSNLAVAANPPVHTGNAPALAGVSSPTVTEADAAGHRGQLTEGSWYWLPERNIVAAPNVWHDEDGRHFDLRYPRVIAEVPDDWDQHAHGCLIAEAPAMLAMLRKMIPSNVCLTNPNIPDNTILPMDVPIGDLRKIAAILARIDGKA